MARFITHQGIWNDLLAPSWDTKYTININTEIAHALFSRESQASEILGVDSDFQKKVTSARDRLPALKIGKHGWSDRCVDCELVVLWE